jgi:SAM-dependent methyltransferase
VLDLGCNEGWFCHLALREGAAQAVGVDVREQNIRRGMLVREHFGIAPERLRFVCASVFDVQPEELGGFDVVLVLGLVYHLENPGGAVRIARRLAAPGALVVIESQLTRQSSPIVHGWGVPEYLESTEASFAARYETPEEQQQSVASWGRGLSLIPNRPALEALLHVAGFTGARWLSADPGDEPQYVAGDRGVIVARAPS